MDNELDFLKNLFSGSDQPLEVFPFLIQLMVTVILSLLIGFFYIKYGNSLSNRKALSKVFVLVSLTTMIIITIVKGSLALSLGLVGALSIVRFRTAIKEPEELAYFFIVISIGLGIGAGQMLVTVIRTDFEMEDVLFSGIYSDAFDGDFVNGDIKNALFENIGNDAIDVSGSKINLENIVIRNAGDKGLSAGEKSKMTGANIAVYDSEIGAASKDDSELSISKIELEGNQLGFTAFQKKPEFGPATLIISDAVLKNNALDHLIENYSSLRLNGQQVPTVDRVKDQMYGVIYGKSSKQ